MKAFFTLLLFVLPLRGTELFLVIVFDPVAADTQNMREYRSQFALDAFDIIQSSIGTRAAPKSVKLGSTSITIPSGSLVYDIRTNSLCVTFEKKIPQPDLDAIGHALIRLVKDTLL